MSVGPRATYDTGATVQTSQGVRVGYRLRGVNRLYVLLKISKEQSSAEWVEYLSMMKAYSGWSTKCAKQVNYKICILKPLPTVDIVTRFF